MAAKTAAASAAPGGSDPNGASNATAAPKMAPSSATNDTDRANAGNRASAARVGHGTVSPVPRPRIASVAVPVHTNATAPKLTNAAPSTADPHGTANGRKERGKAISKSPPKAEEDSGGSPVGGADDDDGDGDDRSLPLELLTRALLVLSKHLSVRTAANVLDNSK